MSKFIKPIFNKIFTMIYSRRILKVSPISGKLLKPNLRSSETNAPDETVSKIRMIEI